MHRYLETDIENFLSFIFGFTFDTVCRRNIRYPLFFTYFPELKFIYKRLQIYELISRDYVSIAYDLFLFSFKKVMFSEKFYYVKQHFDVIFNNIEYSQKMLLERIIEIKEELKKKTFDLYCGFLENEVIINYIAEDSFVLKQCEDIDICYYKLFDSERKVSYDVLRIKREKETQINSLVLFDKEIEDMQKTNNDDDVFESYINNYKESSTLDDMNKYNCIGKITRKEGSNSTDNFSNSFSSNSLFSTNNNSINKSSNNYFINFSDKSLTSINNKICSFDNNCINDKNTNNTNKNNSNISNNIIHVSNNKTSTSNSSKIVIDNTYSYRNRDNASNINNNITDYIEFTFDDVVSFYNIYNNKNNKFYSVVYSHEHSYDKRLFYQNYLGHSDHNELNNLSPGAQFIILGKNSKDCLIRNSFYNYTFPNTKTREILGLNTNNYYSKKNYSQFLNSFTPQFNKKEVIDKFIIRRFRNYVQFYLLNNNLISKANNNMSNLSNINSNVNNKINNTSDITGLFSINKIEKYKNKYRINKNNNITSTTNFYNFGLEFVLKPYLPPFNFNNITFKAYSLSYLVWLFKDSFISSIYTQFSEHYSSKLSDMIINEYDLKNKEYSICEKLRYYITNYHKIYSNYETEKELASTCNSKTSTNYNNSNDPYKIINNNLTDDIDLEASSVSSINLDQLKNDDMLSYLEYYQ